MPGWDETVFEHNGRFFTVTKGTFPKLERIDIHCCGCYLVTRSRYFVDNYWTHDYDDFIKYAISIRTAYVAAFLNDPIELVKKLQHVCYLITPHGLLPVILSCKFPGGPNTQVFRKLGETYLSCVHYNFIVSYETEKQRNDAFDDFWRQQQAMYALLYTANEESVQLKATHETELKTFKNEEDELKSKLANIKTKTDKLKEKQRAELDALYVKHGEGMSRTGYE